MLWWCWTGFPWGGGGHVILLREREVRKDKRYFLGSRKLCLSRLSQDESCGFAFFFYFHFENLASQKTSFGKYWSVLKGHIIVLVEGELFLLFFCVGSVFFSLQWRCTGLQSRRQLKNYIVDEHTRLVHLQAENLLQLELSRQRLKRLPHKMVA